MRLPPNKAISVPSRPFLAHSCTCSRSIVERTLARRKVTWQFFFSGKRKQHKSFFKVPHNKKLKNKVHMRIVSDALPEINNHSVTEMEPSFFLTRWKCTVSHCEESFSPWGEELPSHQLSENSPWDLKDACPDVSSECCLSQAPSSSHAILQAWNDWHRMTQPQGDLSSTYRESCCTRT